MRVLFTTQPALGHFHPLVPLAQALEAAGHQVACACSPSFCPAVEGSGLRCFRAGLDWLESEADLTFPQLRELSPEGETTIWPTIFAEVTARHMVPDLLALARSWAPDLVVRDPLEFGGCLAAECLGLPHATSGASLFARPERWRHVVGAHLAHLRRTSGLPPDPDLAMLYRYLDLAFVPPWFLVNAGDYVAPVVQFLRPASFDRSGDEALAPWVGQLAERPTVYATLGTVFNRAPDIFGAILAGLRDEPINLILAVGRTQDPAQFGVQPPNVHVERYIPQTLLFPYCDVIITHGGFNTVMGALSHGLPMALIPIVADQPDNARRCATLGVGRVIGPSERTPDTICRTVRELLRNPDYRHAAAHWRGRLRSLPGPEYGVALLERLAVERWPQPARGQPAAADLTTGHG